MMGYYLEFVFPRLKVRYIAVNDNEDTERGLSDFVPFKNLINEFMAKDTSRKSKAAFRQSSSTARGSIRWLPLAMWSTRTSKTSWWLTRRPLGSSVKFLTFPYMEQARQKLWKRSWRNKFLPLAGSSIPAMGVALTSLLDSRKKRNLHGPLRRSRTFWKTRPISATRFTTVREQFPTKTKEWFATRRRNGFALREPMKLSSPRMFLK